MLRSLMERSFVDKEEASTLINKYASILGGKAEVIEAEGNVYARVEREGLLLLDFRFSTHVVELYVKVLDRKSLSILEDLGFKDLYQVLREAKGVPSDIVISKVLPSMSLYILINGRDISGAVFPSIKVIIRRDYYEISSSYCRVSSDEDTCDMLAKLRELSFKLWRDLFS